MNKEVLIAEANHMIGEIFEKLSNIASVSLDSLANEKTMLVIVDMNKGFAKKGALYSERVEGIIEPISELAKEAIGRGIKTIAFTDYHTEESPELGAYPPHCMIETDEWELVDELNIDSIEVIKKNSTNGFIEPDFNLPENIENVIVVGDCTDICIHQFAITLKTHFNRLNKKAHVYVPMDLVETFDAPFHKANFMNYVFLSSMMDNGVEVIKNIKLK